MGSLGIVFPDVIDPRTLEALAPADDLLFTNQLVASDCHQVIKDITNDAGDVCSNHKGNWYAS
jgi:hypothetical protein